MRTWFAILPAVWLTLTGFAAMIAWTFRPGFGPGSDPHPASPGVPFWALALGWFAVPLPFAVRGLRSSNPE